MLPSKLWMLFSFICLVTFASFHEVSGTSEPAGPGPVQPIFVPVAIKLPGFAHEDPATEELTADPAAAEELTEDPAAEELTADPAAAEELTEDPAAEELTGDPAAAEELTEDPAAEEFTGDPAAAEELTEDPAAEELTGEPAAEELSGDLAAEEPSADADADIIEDPAISAVETKTLTKTEAAGTRKCNMHHFKHYEVRDCAPVYKDGETCPTRYECLSDEARGRNDTEKCYYKGMEYAQGQSMPEIVEDYPCSFDCTCRFSFTGVTEPVCAIGGGCGFRQPPPGCRSFNVPNQCCTNTVCETATEDYELDPASKPDAKTCNWEGRTYQLGQYMDFNFVDDLLCTSCICTEEYTGPSGPGCSNTTCALDYKYSSQFAEGCVPIYFSTICCFNDWLCPTSNKIDLTKLAEPDTTPSKIAWNGCKLGSYEIAIGDSLPLKECTDPRNCFTATCTTPPDLTCTYDNI